MKCCDQEQELLAELLNNSTTTNDTTTATNVLGENDISSTVLPPNDNDRSSAVALKFAFFNPFGFIFSVFCWLYISFDLVHTTHFFSTRIM